MHIVKKKKICKKYFSFVGSNVESYDLFIEKSLEILSDKVYLSFILPESLLNVRSHIKIRELILNNFNIKYLVYLGNAFDKIQYLCIIAKLQKTTNKNRSISPTYFSLTMNDLEYGIINKIVSIENKVFLKNNSSFALGIVVGDNNKYIIAKVDNLLQLNDINRINKVYDEIDLLIAKEYGLNIKEYKYIYEYYSGQEMFLSDK